MVRDVLIINKLYLSSICPGIDTAFDFIDLREMTKKCTSSIYINFSKYTGENFFFFYCGRVPSENGLKNS